MTQKLGFWYTRPTTAELLLADGLPGGLARRDSRPNVKAQNWVNSDRTRA